VGAPEKLLHRRLADFGQFCVECCSPLLCLIGLHEVVVEGHLDDFKQQLGFTGFNFYDLARVLTLHRVSGEVADVPHGVNHVRKVAREFRQHFVDLFGQVLLRRHGDFTQYMLQAAAAESGTRLRAVCQHQTRLSVVMSELLRDASRQRRTCHATRVDQVVKVELLRGAEEEDDLPAAIWVWADSRAGTPLSVFVVVEAWVASDGILTRLPVDFFRAMRALHGRYLGTGFFQQKEGRGYEKIRAGLDPPYFNSSIVTLL
jgi:hypothetical protein